MTIEQALTEVHQLSKDIDIADYSGSEPALFARLHKIEGLCRAILIRIGYDHCPGMRQSLQDVAGCEFCNQVVT